VSEFLCGIRDGGFYLDAPREAKKVLGLARDGRGDDPYGDRAEFIQLVERFRRISQQNGERSVSQQR
jgi:hypothetical protein